MKILVIVPTKFLKKSEPGPYYCYSSFLYDDVYLKFFQERSTNTILDYSPFLPRKPFIPSLLEGLRKVRPKLIVLPSIDYSRSRTIELATSFLRHIKGSGIIGVVQGVDIDSMNSCYQFLRNYCTIIGLPSVLEKIARREEIIRDLGIKEKTFYIEVFSNPYEEIPPSSCMGICTSYPARLAQDLRKLEEYKPTPRPLNLEIDSKDMIEQLLDRNITEYREVISEGRSTVLDG